MDVFIPLLYIVVLYGAFLAGSLYLRLRAVATGGGNGAAAQPVPKATILLLLAIGVPTMLQCFFPPILPALERNYRRFVDGEWWRLITPLFVQDGGISGSIFNLVSLLFMAHVGERVWGSVRCIAIFFGCGVLSEVVALSWQPIGAGNSVANFGLAASVAVVALIYARQRSIRFLACIGLGAGLILLLLRDIHGAATIIGAIVGLMLLWLNGHSIGNAHASS